MNMCVATLFRIWLIKSVVGSEESLIDGATECDYYLAPSKVPYLGIV